MYNVSNDYLAAMSEPIQEYKLRIRIGRQTITDAEIVAGSFSIKNQCGDTDIVQIGSVYAGELKMIIAPDVIQRNTWEGLQIIPEEGMMISENPAAYEYVPLGVFTVAEANHSDSGVSITAYDNMLKFDKVFILSTSNGQPFDFLSMICRDCGVTLGMTRAQVEALPNGSAPIALYSENDCQTYRDVLFWIAQFLASFATMDRSGRLVLRQYTDTVTDRVAAAFRFQGSTFSDFVTEYSGASFQDIDTQEVIYVSGGGLDNKLTYNLGGNPFLQYGTMSTRKQYVINILNQLKKIHYTPFRTRYLNTPAYDLGDVIQNPGGVGAGAVSCIMSIDYSFTNRVTVEGFGKNPALEAAQTKEDKDIAGLVSKVEKNSVYFYNFKNAEALEIGPGLSENLIDIRFATAEARQVMFQAEILADATATLDEVLASITYYLNDDEITDYHPVETWTEDGKHIISLFYVAAVEPQTLYTWRVDLESSGGTITIGEGQARGTLWGTGLVADNTWAGYIDLEDTIGAGNLNSIGAAEFTEEGTAEFVEFEDIELEDTISAGTLSSIGAAEFTEVVIINKNSVYYEGLTWEDLAAMSWSELADNWLW